MDLFDINAAAFADDPWSIYERLRAEAPVYWSESVQAFVLTKHKDVLAGLRNREFVADFPFRLNRELFGRAILDLDGPLHVAARRALAPVFSQAGMRDIVDPIIASGVEFLFEDRPERIDQAFVERLGRDLPYYLTTRLLGIPFEDKEWLRPRLGAIASVMEFPQAPDPSEGIRAADELADYFQAHLDARVAGDAGIGPLGAHIDSPVPPWDGWSLPRSLVLFLFAGTETTTCVIANTMRALMLHGVDLGAVANDRARIDALITESIRWDPPTHSVLRFAKADTVVGGVSIPRHSRILLCLASANRDPEAFEHPDHWNPERERGISVAFGLGAHACLGARTAHREIAAMLEALASHVGSFEPGGEPGVGVGNSFRRPADLRYAFAQQTQGAMS